MDSEAYGAYEIVHICCNAYREQKGNWSENERNLPQGRRVFMDTLLDKNHIKNLTQRPVPVDSAGNNKIIEKSTITKTKKTDPIKTMNKSGKMSVHPIHVTPASRKIQFNLLMDELNHVFSEDDITQKTRHIKPQLSENDITQKTRHIKPQLIKKDFRELYCVPNSRPAFPTEIQDKKEFAHIKPQLIKKDFRELYCVPNSRPAFPTEIQDKKEFAFRSRSNACISQNKKMYLNKIKYTDT